MPTTKKSLDPRLEIGDKLVQVGPPTWSQFKSVVDAFAGADLPLPELNDEAIRSQFAAIQADAKLSGSLNLADLAGLLYTFVAGNLPTLYQWLLKHPPLVQAVVVAGSNLTTEEAASLSPGEMLRVARAVYAELVNDGVFSEAASFFGALVGLRPGQPTASDQSAPPAGTTPKPAAD